MSAKNKAASSKSIPSQGVSQIDVARLAGVSQAAVSRTLTPGGIVSNETREKVMSAIKQLGYRPNVIARSLVQNSTNIIGLVVKRFTNPFYAQMIQDFTKALQEQGYWALVVNIADNQRLEDALPMILQYQVDGMIITSATLSSKLAKECAQSGTPVVLFNRYVSDGHTHVVSCDNYEGGRIVADALIDGGHKRIAYIAGEELSSTNRDRENGFVSRLKERGAALAIRESADDYGYELGYAAANRLLQSDFPPDAVFCANDLIAMATLDVARCKLNIQVPSELSIIGFDDISSVGWSPYDLTTVRQPIDQLVDNTIQVLIDAINTPNSAVMVKMIAPYLVWRSSARRPSQAKMSEE